MKPVVETLLFLLSVVIPSVFCVFFWILIRPLFPSYISAGTSSLLRTSVQPLSCFLRASVLPSAASTLPSVEAPTFVRFLTFLYWVCHFRIFHSSLSAFFHTSLSPFFLNKLMRFLKLSFISSTWGSPVGETSILQCNVLLSVVLWIIIRQYFS